MLLIKHVYITKLYISNGIEPNMKKLITLLSLGLSLSLVLAGCSTTLAQPTASDVEVEAGSSIQDSAVPPPIRQPNDIDDYRIVTLLPRDAIPAIDNPQFLDVEAADQEYAPDEEVLGIFFDDEAYSVPLLSSHEIVNDTVAGRKIAVTW
jgi:hypothetical protein